MPLPAGFGTKTAVFRLSVPRLPSDRVYSFSEHVLSDHAVTDRVIACGRGGFALSEDLGRSWRSIDVTGHAHLTFMLSRCLPGGEILLLALNTEAGLSPPDQAIHLVIVDAKGSALHSQQIRGARWHGPRGIDLSHRTLMYAEYTPNEVQRSTGTRRKPSRVWRSRDFGRSWEIVFQQPDVRHFHFLQARPGVVGEWWLASGDAGSESRIWRSTDDGDRWTDLTERFGPTVEADGFRFPRRLFRLTDLAWDHDTIIWGTDDPLQDAVDCTIDKPVPGARVFRFDPVRDEAPKVLGCCGPEIRNVVELEDHYVFITQSTRPFKQNPPQVLLSRKGASGTAALVPCFEIEQYSDRRSGFTYSRASRAAKDGIFFSYRGSEDVFPSGNRILKWQIEFQ